MSLMVDDEVLLGNDNRYKSYTTAMDRILKQFGHSTQWTDLIPHLTKLQRVKFSYITLKLSSFFIFEDNR